MCGPDIDTSYQDFQREEAIRARDEETARQARIDDGIGKIKAIFEGGTVDGATYAGMTPVLEQREQAMRDFYLPQLETQAADARDELTFGLKRAGLLNSTAAGEKQGDLGRDLALERGSILAKIASDLSGTQSRINQNRASIEAGLRSSGDQTAATDAALRSAVTFRAEEPELSRLPALFYGIGTGIGAARQGYETGKIRAAATPAPLNRSSGRNVA